MTSKKSTSTSTSYYDQIWHYSIMELGNPQTVFGQAEDGSLAGEIESVALRYPEKSLVVRDNYTDKRIMEIQPYEYAWRQQASQQRRRD